MVAPYMYIHVGLGLVAEDTHVNLLSFPVHRNCSGLEPLVVDGAVLDFR